MRQVLPLLTALCVLALAAPAAADNWICGDEDVGGNVPGAPYRRGQRVSTPEQCFSPPPSSSPSPTNVAGDDEEQTPQPPLTRTVTVSGRR